MPTERSLSTPKHTICQIITASSCRQPTVTSELSLPVRVWLESRTGSDSLLCKTKKKKNIRGRVHSATNVDVQARQEDPSTQWGRMPLRARFVSGGRVGANASRRAVLQNTPTGYNGVVWLVGAGGVRG